MNPPRWNTANADMVRAELARRVDAAATRDREPAEAPLRSRMSKVRVAVAFVIALAFVAPASVFAISQQHRFAGGPDGSQMLSVITHEALTGTAGNTAEIVGTLEATRTGGTVCFWVTADPSAPRQGRSLLVFPPGYSATASLELIGASGDRIAASGDEVRVTASTAGSSGAVATVQGCSVASGLVDVLAVTRADASPTGAVFEPGAALVGLWKVTAEGEGANTWVAFRAGSVTVQRDRRLLYATWVTGDQRIAASVSGWNGGLKDPTVPWLEDATTFQRRGADRVLLAGDGTVLATLTPSTAAPAPKNAAADSMTVPDGSATAPTLLAVERAPTDPALTRQALLGRWRTGETDSDGGRPFLELREDGTYRGSDGCNGILGRWLLLPGSRLVLTSSNQTEVGCGNLQSVPKWVAATRTGTITNGTLTLFDQSGARLGSFDRR